MSDSETNTVLIIFCMRCLSVAEVDILLNPKVWPGVDESQQNTSTGPVEKREAIESP